MLGRSSHGAACSPRTADVCGITSVAPHARRAGRDGQGALASGGHPRWGTTTAAAARVSHRVTPMCHCVSPVIDRCQEIPGGAISVNQPLVVACDTDFDIFVLASL